MLLYVAADTLDAAMDDEAPSDGSAADTPDSAQTRTQREDDDGTRRVRTGYRNQVAGTCRERRVPRWGLFIRIAIKANLFGPLSRVVAGTVGESMLLVGGIARSPHRDLNTIYYSLGSG